MKNQNIINEEKGNDVNHVLTAGFIDDKILDKAIETWGIDAQLEMVIEECLELALALQKLKRLRGDMTQKEKNVIDEIADVKIMIKQAEKIFGSEPVNERVDFKMNRLNERLSEGVA
jgi:NTP pyrophosphatase (non-canonical NTP hydrolase)